MQTKNTAFGKKRDVFAASGIIMAFKAYFIGSRLPIEGAYLRQFIFLLYG
jgi:hypothetical protein